MLDVTRDPIEVAPMAHYSMGGVWVCPAHHSTDVDGLYVIGEAASGLHGAKRLGGNSLIELWCTGVSPARQLPNTPRGSPCLVRRETRGCHNCADYPSLEPDLQMKLVWSPRPV